MYFEKFLNEERKSCIRLIPCQLLKSLTKVRCFIDLKDLLLKKQSEHPELYPTWKALLSDQTLFNQHKNKKLAENEIIITNCHKCLNELPNCVLDDGELTKLMVDKLRAIYTAKDVMNDIYRYGGTINTLRPRPRFIVENTDLVDDTSGNYIQSSKDPNRKIPMVDQMVQDYKESRSLFERLWRRKLFEEKQIVRNALCKEYGLDEEDKNNDIVIKFNEFNGEMTYNEGFALVNGKLIYFEKLQNDKLPYIFIECKSRKIVMIERQLEDFIKDCDGCLRLKNYHYSTKENPKFTNYEDILCDGNYTKDLLSRPLTKAQLKKINSGIKFEKNKKQKAVTAPTNNSMWDNVFGDDSTRKYTLEDDKCMYASMWDNVFGDNAYTIISNIWDNFNGIDGNVYVNNMSIPSSLGRMTSIGNGSQQASTWQIGSQTINTPAVPAANGINTPNNNSSEETKLKALQASTKELDEMKERKKERNGKNNSEIILD